MIVASEPGDDEPGWVEVPGDSVVTADPEQVSVTKLDRQAPLRLELPENPRTMDERIPTR